MKLIFRKLLCAILAVSVLLSCIVIPTFADGTETEDDGNGSATVVYNRDFSDGWGVYNGLGNPDSILKGHNFFIDHEMTVDYDYNYFARFEAVTSLDGFAQLGFDTVNFPDEKKVYVTFDIMADDYIDVGNILYFRSKGGNGVGVNITLLGINDNTLHLFGKNEVTVPLENRWVSVQIIFDYTDEEKVNNDRFDITIKATLDGKEYEQTLTAAALTPHNIGVDFLRFGFNTASESETKRRAGMSYCIDNLVAYCGTVEPLSKAEIDAQGYGVSVNPEQIKTETIMGGSDEIPLQTYLDSSLCMKLGVDYALIHGEREKIYDGTYGAPVEHEGRIIVPLELLLRYVKYDYYLHEDGKSYDITTGTSSTYLTMGREIANVGGETVYLDMAPGYYTDPGTDKSYAVVALSDVEKILPGFYVTYDSMGLIIICQKKEVLNRNDHLQEMIGLMSEFIFDFASKTEVYEDARNETENFTHPYLIADQSVFDRLIAIYDGRDTKEYEIDLKKGLTAQVKRAYDLYECFALATGVEEIESEKKNADGTPVLDENGAPVTEIKYVYHYDEWLGIDWTKPDSASLLYPHVDTNGYDPNGGRQGESTNVTGWAQDIAFGYAMTGDIKLAQCAYALLCEVGEWNHWAPGHFLNTADASQRYALALDWIYNGIKSLENEGVVENAETGDIYSTSYLESLLYKNGVHMGYLVSNNQWHGWKRDEGDVCYYTTMENNWNAVCTAGMWMASLVLLGNDTYRDEASELISMNIKTLATNGLDQYAPDGSYVESPSYWGYGTNSLLLGLMCLYRTTGKDYGYFDTWGLDKTCYFACCIESSDYEMFNYHDSSLGQSVDSSSFYFMAEAMNDPALAVIRSLHVNSGKKGFSVRDYFFYPFDMDMSVEVQLPLDYYAEGIDAFTTRSSWEQGALFAGIIGGDNSASHGQIDSGDFVYSNAGTKWIVDLGNDQYNVHQYFTSPTRYRYYRNNAEGNNVLALTTQPEDIPHGQKINSAGVLTKSYSNEYGSYAIIDNTEVYGGYATSALRGMLLTNNRQTLVIQDEVTLSSAEKLYWFAHIDASEVKYELSSDAKTIYLYTTDKNGYTLNTVRLTLLSNKPTEFFKIEDAGWTRQENGRITGNFYLEGDMGTVDYYFSQQNDKNKLPEYSRESFKRISIESKGLNGVEYAVVIELIEDRSQPVGYSLTPMNSWEPVKEHAPEISDDEVKHRGNPRKSNITSGVKKAENYHTLGDCYTNRLPNYYEMLVSVEFINQRFDRSELTAYADDLAIYDALKAEYDIFADTVCAHVGTEKGIIKSLMGI